MSVDREPLLVFDRSTHESLQDEAMRLNKYSGHEAIVFLLLRRAWLDEREVYWPSEMFVPHPRDYATQTGESCSIGQAAADKLIDRMRLTNTHLFLGHTHPPDSMVRYSEGDLAMFSNTSRWLSLLSGGHTLISGVFNHVLSLSGAEYAYWYAGKRWAIEVASPPQRLLLSGRDFALVGAGVTGRHSCPRERWVPPALRVGNPGMWTGTLLPSASHPKRVLDDVPGDQVFIRITGWPLECDCYLRHLDKSRISLAELGYYNHRPWRSG